MLFLEPGKYAYQVVTNGIWKLDNNNTHRAPNGQGGENSIIIVGGDQAQKAPSLLTLFYNKKQISILANNDPNQVYAFWNNQLIPIEKDKYNDGVYNFSIPAQALNYSLSYIRIFSYNKYGTSNELMIPLMDGEVANSANNLPANAWQTSIIYNVFIDRFFDGDSTNNNPLPDSIVLPQANYNGGDLAGIIAKIKVGYFKELGINSLWLSPVVKNTEGAFGYWPNPKTKFSAYHGYWPTSFTQINPHFGNAELLKQLVELAHQNKENIFLDMVANHVHQEHPYYKAHPECATELYLPDSSLNLERWDDHRLTTWFDKFLPTLNLELPETAKMLADSTVWWAKEFGIDGFRYDAAKHIPLSFWRTLTKELKDSVISQGQNIYQLGETYGSSELIGSYISSGLLDAQFDFNVYDAALSVFAGGNDMNILSGRLKESISAYGSHNLMANITGNQDRARFISYAGGDLKFDEDAKVAGWTRDIEIGDSLAFKKLQMLMAFNMTIPGIPVIYYGDEFGMPGGNDPDCRRMMRFGSELSTIEKENFDVTKKLIQIRKSNMALLYGDLFEETETTENSMAFSRQYFDQFAWIGFNNSDSIITFKVFINPNVNEEQLKTNFGNVLKPFDKGFTVEIPPYSFEIITTN
jgi:glycosidase